MFASPWIIRSVADADIPSSWSSAGRNALGNSLWILPLVTFERATEERYYQAGALGALWCVALVIAVKLHVIEELISSRERQQQLLTWALILAGAILLAFGIFRLASSPTTLTEGVGKSDVQLRLDATIIERDKAKQELEAAQQARQDELSATKTELEKTRQELAAAKAAKSPEAPPATNPVHVDYRRLSATQMRILIREFTLVKADIPRVLFTYFPDFQGEAPQYMRDFIEAFRRAGIVASDNGVQNIAEAGQEGIFLCVPDIKKPPATAEKISRALDAASIAHKFAPLEPGRPEFTFFVGPNPL